ncbi:hypothetical protein AAES_04894 [Amazona aestiva]|uniref:Uncharacterized protein n=1 Tax=Amazona aestiva TaxID=12930 RepID=A0A0Q3U4T5_AMAAE|nr:hypothetical protein AAES_04894 [Amazona aestiva]
MQGETGKLISVKIDLVFRQAISLAGFTHCLRHGVTAEQEQRGQPALGEGGRAPPLVTALKYGSEVCSLKRGKQDSVSSWIMGLLADLQKDNASPTTNLLKKQLLLRISAI